MKLKTVELDGKTYAEVNDGRPVYVGDDNKDIPFDGAAAAGTIKRLNGEAKSHRERAEAAEGKLKGFDGIEDAEAARKAMETVKNLDEGKLLTAGKVEEIKAAAARAAEERVQQSAKASAEEIKKLTGERDSIRGAYEGEKISNAFATSKYVSDKIAVPVDMVQNTFGKAFKVEDGKLVGYDSKAERIFSRARPGELATFDEAFEVLVEAYPNKDYILKGSGSSGTGTTHQRGNGGGNGKTMKRSEFSALPLPEQARLMTSKDRPSIVD